MAGRQNFIASRHRASSDSAQSSNEHWEHKRRYGAKRKANVLEGASSSNDSLQGQQKSQLPPMPAEKLSDQHHLFKRPRHSQEAKPANKCPKAADYNGTTPSGITERSSSKKRAGVFFKKGEVICSENNKYHVLEFAGQGTFGEVVLCWEEGTENLVALKILKRKSSHAHGEVSILQRLCKENVDEFNIVRLHETFFHKNHRCLVFEALEQNLYDFLRNRDFRPVPLNGIRLILKQLLITLVKLKELKLIHTDLKPENVMLVNTDQDPFRVKVVDFGCSMNTSSAFFPTYIQSRHYRAPEIILGLPFGVEIDMWSLGCIASQLFLGRPLHPGRSEYDQIRIIIKTHGFPSADMLNLASKTVKFFLREKRGRGRAWRLKTLREYERETKIKYGVTTKYIFTNLDEIVKVKVPKGLSKENLEAEMFSRREFVHLLKRMLAIDRKERISPEDALKHSFLAEKKAGEHTRRKSRTSYHHPPSNRGNIFGHPSSSAASVPGSQSRHVRPQHKKPSTNLRR